MSQLLIDNMGVKWKIIITIITFLSIAFVISASLFHHIFMQLRTDVSDPATIDLDGLTFVLKSIEKHQNMRNGWKCI